MPRCAILMLIAAVMMPAPLCLHAQQSSIVKLTVEKKPGAHEGPAIATVKGPAKVKGKIVIKEKAGRIATHALETSGGTKSLSLATLVALGYQDSIYAPASNPANTAYLQFLRDGDSLSINSGGEVERGRWIKAGSSFEVTSPKRARTVWPETELHAVTGIPATGRITVRLLQPLSSRTAKVGMEVKAVSITPALSHDSILIPQGSEFTGKIIEAHGVGWGVKHESAALTVHFDTARLPGDRILKVDARVFKVENAQESVLPRLTMRADFGETFSQNPSIIRDSYLGYEPVGLDDTYTTDVTNSKPAAKFVQQRATVGFAFTF
jgi:hypothetical protein